MKGIRVDVVSSREVHIMRRDGSAATKLRFDCELSCGHHKTSSNCYIPEYMYCKECK